MRIYVFIILLCVWLAGCRKREHYEPSATLNGPVFQADGNLDGNSVSFRAGVNGYYMFSSYHTDTSNVYVYTGDLRPENCADCGPSLQIQFRAYKPSNPSQSISIDSSLLVKSYAYVEESNTNMFLAVFKNSFNQTAVNYHWDFGDSSESVDAQPSHLYRKAGKYNVCLTIKGSSGSQSSVCNVEDISFPWFNVAIGTLSAPVGKTVKFTQNVQGGQAPYFYDWKFDDPDTAKIPSPVHTFPSHGVHSVSLTVRDANNRTCSARYNAPTDSTFQCAANYSVSVSPIPNLALGQVNLTWKDNQGNVYRTGAGPQPPGSYFKILDIQDYPANEKGERVKKIRVQFSGRFYRGSQFITIEQMQAIIAIAYP